MRAILYLVVVMIVLSCKGKEADAIPDPEPDDVVAKKAQLIFPVKNEICSDGSIVSPTESKINFNWTALENAESYQLVVKNLSTNQTIVQDAISAPAEVRLQRNTPYSWMVISRFPKNRSSESEVWKFYNSGPGVTSYAPFAAEAVSPVRGQSIVSDGGKITLKWSGADPDGDIVNYDVYFGLLDPVIYKADVAEAVLTDVAVVSGKNYFWKVISRDSKGNTSDSGLFQFSVK